MKVIFTSLLFIIGFNSFSQNHLIGVRGGMNWTNILGESAFETEFRSAGMFGLSYEYNLNKHLFTSIEFNYVNRKVALVGTWNDGINPSYKVFSTMAFRYFSFPVKFGYKTSGRLQSFVDIGLVPSFINKASIKAPFLNDFGVITEYGITDIKHNLPTFDLGGMAEVGLGYSIGPRTLIFTSATYQQSFTTITNKNYFDNETQKLYGFGVSFGMKVAISKSAN